MATLEDRLAALAARIGNVVRDGLAAKADDSAVVKLTGAQSVNGIKTFGSPPVVAAGTAAGNPIRWDDASRTNARTPTAHTHPATDVTAAPRTITYAALAALAPASGVALDVVTCTLTGNPTITPAAGTDGQIIRLRLLAGASARTVTLAAAVRITTGITVRTLSIPANQAGIIGLEYMAGLSAWMLFSAYATS